jgi:hypothetical protein
MSNSLYHFAQKLFQEWSSQLRLVTPSTRSVTPALQYFDAQPTPTSPPLAARSTVLASESPTLPIKRPTFASGHGRVEEVDNFNFLPRVRVRVLMLNGRCDCTFPVDSSQKPYFRWLGMPERDKRHVLYDAAHDVIVNRTQVVKEVLSRLDPYLGPVAR